MGQEVAAMWACSNNSELVINAVRDFQNPNTSRKVRKGIDVAESFVHISYGSAAGDGVLYSAKGVSLAWPFAPFTG